MKTEILKILSASGDDFVSGQFLCERLGVSRTAVWKAIRSLEEDGFEMEAVQNKGYRLKKIPDLLSEETCALYFHTQWAGKEREIWKEIDSTNRRAKQAGEEGASHGLLVTTNVQTAGKGRRGRAWTMPEGASLPFSILLRPQLSPERISMVTLVAALAVNRGLKSAAGLETQIKWPNDIVSKGKKLCGILTEMSTELTQIHYVVVGIGINIHMEEFPEEIRDTATSVFLETGRHIDRSFLLAEIMENFEKLFDQFEKDGDLRNLRAEYEEKLANKNTGVRILEKGKEREGRCLGISDNGALVVENAEGQTEEIISGEVSVRGIYGYV